MVDINYRPDLTCPAPGVQPVNPVAYLAALTPGRLFRFISTHPHMDHLSGLHLLWDTVGLESAWVLPNHLSPDLPALSPSRLVDWQLYAALRDATGKALGSCRILRPMPGGSSLLWTPDNIKILAPTPELLSLADRVNRPNVMSYVLLVTIGAARVLLTGDAERPTWEHILARYEEDIAGISVLKAAHHGLVSGFCREALKVMRPQVTVISAGPAEDNDDVSEWYEPFSGQVLRTWETGTVIVDCAFDGEIRVVTATC